jgi:hypothetical protein
MSKASDMERRLTQQDLLDLFRYDEETGKLFWQKSINPRGPVGREVGSYNGTGYKHTQIYGTRLLVHRIVWCMNTGGWPEHNIDHINGIRDDNRMPNLRDVTVTRNRRNVRLLDTNTSGHVGVIWIAPRGKWRAQITLGDQFKCLGEFASVEDAIAARQAASVQHGFSERHGARL